jgi:hypothetical protein
MSSFLITDTTDSILEKLDYMASAPKEELPFRAQELIDEWEKKDWIIHTCVNAETVLETERNLVILKKLAENGCSEEFRNQCINTYSLVYSIRKSENLNLQNIF